MPGARRLLPLWCLFLISLLPCGATFGQTPPATGQPAAQAAGAPSVVTRQALAAALDRFYRVAPSALGPAFADVPPGSPYAPAIEAATGHGLMTGVTLTTFQPAAPVTRLALAQTLALDLGLAHVAQDLDGAALPYADAATIPRWARGAVKVVTDLGLLGGGADFRPSALVTPAELAAALARLRALPPDAVGREADLAAAWLSLGGPSLVDVGHVASFWAVVHDRSGYALPATVAFYAHRGRMRGATYTAEQPGVDRVVAYVPGTKLSASTAVTVLAPDSLVPLRSSPTVCLAATPCPVAFALTAHGRLDPVATRTVVLAWQGAASGQAEVRARAGVATFSLRLPTGTYQLTATAPGLPPDEEGLAVLSSPLGLSVPAAPSSLPFGKVTELPLVLSSQPPAGARLALAVAVEGPLSAAVVRSGASLFLRLTPTDQGDARVSLTAPGGAATPLSLSFTIPPRGALNLRCAPTSPAGAAVTCQATAPGAGSGTWVTFAYQLPDGATLHRSARAAPAAAVSQVVTRAGTLTVTATAAGYQAATALVSITPGPAVALAATAAPSPLVPRGETAAIRASLVDVYGNPVDQPAAVTVTGGDPQVGAVTTVARQALGATTVATYTATAASGTTHVTVASLGFAPVTLTFTDVAQPQGVLDGVGLWLPYWVWRGEKDQVILQEALSHHARALYLEVATTNDGGFYGGPGLDDLLQKAHADGLALFAWVFPDLFSPAADAAFSAAAAAYTSPLGGKVDGLALDIEQNLAPSAVGAYARTLRQEVGPGTLLIGVTYPPSHGAYPWSTLAPYVDAFAPMDYWHVFERDYTYDEVYQSVAGSIATIERQDGRPSLPVLPIAQAYDVFTNGPGAYSPTPLEEEAALAATRAAGEPGLSFYQFGTMTAREWAVLAEFPFP